MYNYDSYLLLLFIIIKAFFNSYIEYTIIIQIVAYILYYKIIISEFLNKSSCI